jgi:hypothetical protein
MRRIATSRSRSGPACGVDLARAQATALLAAAAACVASCATSEVHVYKMYGGPPRPDAELAIVDIGDAMGVMVGTRKVARYDYSKIQLLPGTYPLYWECEYGVSVMIEPTGFATGSASADVELQAGHVYSLHCDRTTGYGYRTYQWIRDDTEGRIVAGQTKP